MENHDSSAPPSHRLLHHHHHDHHQHQHQHQPPPQLHPAAFLGSHNQPQQYQPNNSYPLPNNNNSVNTTTSTTMNNNMMHQQNPRFPFNTIATASIAQKPLDHHFSDGSPSGGGSGGLSIEPVKKKRGRPRKYSPDNGIGLGLSSPAPANQIASAVRDVASGGAGGTPSSENPSKRNRGRPPGSGKKQLDALGIPGVGFTPHVILVAAGEDIASKIMAFSQQGPRTVCILSANGSVSNVTLRQPAMSTGTVTYEGRFEIISLSGSLLSEGDNNCNRIGGLNISLASSDGRVLGGGVAGILKAASLVQVIVGSFIADGKKSKSGPSLMPHSNMLNFGAQATGISPASPGASSESAEDNDDSPLNHGSGPYTNAGQPVQNIPMYANMGWANMKMLPN